MKKLILLLLIFLFLLSFALAQEDAGDFNLQDSYNWLLSQSEGGSFNEDVFATSLAILAFDGVNLDVDAYLAWLDSQLDETNFCYPKTACKTQDTAMAMIALLELQEDENMPELIDWLANAQKESDVTGDWLLEITTDASGTCTLLYLIGETPYEKEIEVDAGIFPGCGSSTFYDLDECLGGGVIVNNPSIEMTLDCAALEDTSIMTHLYKSSNDYYLLDSEEGDLFTFKVNNGCFGRGSGDTCNKEASLYSSWALKEAGSDINSLVYLRNKYDETDVMDNVIMYFITNDNTYLETLAGRQLADGSFDRDAFNTGLAVLAMNKGSYSTEVSDAKLWLEENVEDDGSWVDAETTAMVLYAVYSGESVASPDTGTVECEEDEDCDEDEICVSSTCVSTGAPECVSDYDCDDGYECKSGVCILEEEEVCVVNNVCEVSVGENSANCFDDCFQYCGDDICDAGETCEADCGSISPPPPVDQPEEKDYTWLWIIIIILILAGAGAGVFYLWEKGFIKLPFKQGVPKGPRTPPYQPFTRQPVAKPRQAQVRTSKRTVAESELDKSLEEARRLLKK